MTDDTEIPETVKPWVEVAYDTGFAAGVQSACELVKQFLDSLNRPSLPTVLAALYRAAAESTVRSDKS